MPKEKNYPTIQIPVEIQECDQCPYAKIEKVYTGNSWDDIREITCTKLEKKVYEYLDWYEHSPVPDECPFVQSKLKAERENSHMIGWVVFNKTNNSYLTENNIMDKDIERAFVFEHQTIAENHCQSRAGEKVMQLWCTPNRELYLK